MYSVFFCLLNLTHLGISRPNGNVASLGGSVRNESEAILEMKNTSNPPPHYREMCRRLNQSPRSGGDQPSTQSHGIQSGSSSTAQSTKADAIAGCLDTDHNNHRRVCPTSKDIELSRYPAKERNGGYWKAKDLTVQARVSFNLIATAHLLPDHQNAYIHKHIHRFPGNIPG